jgi:hypothetical protein
MTFVLVAGVIAGLLCPTFGMSGTGSFPISGVLETATLAGLRDRARPLLVFAPDAGDARLQEQLKAISDNAAEAADRDLVVVALPVAGEPATETKLTPEDAAAARRRFHVKPDQFLVILIGKDGGEKLRSEKPIPLERLRTLIDAMPMRKEEMKAKDR